jgi:hypothetical protein
MWNERVGPDHARMARELRVLDTPTESHQLDTVGDRVRLDLTDRSATVLVGDVAGMNTEIEITPTGPLAGDYFVGTFDGARHGRARAARRGLRHRSPD